MTAMHQFSIADRKPHPHIVAFCDVIKRGGDKSDIKIVLTFGRLEEILAELDTNE